MVCINEQKMTFGTFMLNEQKIPEKDENRDVVIVTCNKFKESFT